MDGCLKRHEEEEVMQVYYSLNNESQNILNMINDRWLPWWGGGCWWWRRVGGKKLHI